MRTEVVKLSDIVKQSLRCGGGTLVTFRFSRKKLFNLVQLSVEILIFLGE